MEQLTTLLTALAERLGTTVEYLWGVLLKQAYIDGIFNIIYCIIPIILIYPTYKYAKYIKLKWNEWVENGWGEEIFPCVGFSVLCVFFIILLLFTITEFIPTAITAFNNPEYWALKEILKQL